VAGHQLSAERAVGKNIYYLLCRVSLT
jgi:hypothetical protein